MINKTGSIDLIEYEKDIGRLIKQVKSLQASKWSPTPLKKEIDSLAESLEKVAQLLESGAAQGVIEARYDQERERDTARTRPAYKAIVWGIRDLCDAAKEASGALPNPRTRYALPYAALGLLHLRYKHGFAYPLLSNVSEDIKELERVCKGAGIVLTPDRFRTALTAALANFDPHIIPPGCEWIINQ